jgi:hypothetical protein
MRPFWSLKRIRASRKSLRSFRIRFGSFLHSVKRQPPVAPEATPTAQESELASDVSICRLIAPEALDGQVINDPAYYCSVLFTHLAEALERFNVASPEHIQAVRDLENLIYHKQLYPNQDVDCEVRMLEANLAFRSCLSELSVRKQRAFGSPDRDNLEAMANRLAALEMSRAAMPWLPLPRSAGRPSEKSERKLVWSAGWEEQIRAELSTEAFELLLKEQGPAKAAAHLLSLLTGVSVHTVSAQVVTGDRREGKGRRQAARKTKT